jgi:hypothetical protein
MIYIVISDTNCVYFCVLCDVPIFMHDELSLMKLVIFDLSLA